VSEYDTTVKFPSFLHFLERATASSLRRRHWRRRSLSFAGVFRLVQYARERGRARRARSFVAGIMIDHQWPVVESESRALRAVLLGCDLRVLEAHAGRPKTPPVPAGREADLASLGGGPVAQARSRRGWHRIFWDAADRPATVSDFANSCPTHSPSPGSSRTSRAPGQGLRRIAVRRPK